MQIQMFQNRQNKNYNICYYHMFIFCFYFKQLIFVLGVVLINYGRFLARMCLILFLVFGKNLNPNGHHLLAQKPKILRSTSFCSCINAGRNMSDLCLKLFLCMHVTKSLLLRKFENFQIWFAIYQILCLLNSFIS